jgi:hypothetical protein
MREVTVFRTWDEPLADMALDFLREAGIPSFKLGDVPRSVLPFTIDGLGEIEIRVSESDAPLAMEIIEARFTETGGDVKDNESGEDDVEE